jgi:hypothetical protein
VKKLTRHHREPKSLAGIREKRNISFLPPKKHQPWHLLFTNSTPEQIATAINTLYLDPDYEFIVKKR